MTTDIKPAHTPGPWVGWFQPQATATSPVAHGRVIGPPWADGKEGSGYTNEADVRLIASAPDMAAKIAVLETTQGELVKALEDAKGFLTTLRRSRENEEGAVDWALSDLNKALARAKQAAEQGKGESNG